jgi:arginyl-tRNA synthetase
MLSLTHTYQKVKKMKEEIREELRRAVADAYGAELTASLQVDIPPNPELGDFAIGMFPLAKELRAGPPQIAQKVAAAIDTSSGVIESAEAAGPYVNVRVKSDKLFDMATACDLTGRSPSGKRVMVECLSPNTNKPLHLGHMRNGVLGMAIANLLEWQGHEVVKANLINDRGVHICKSMEKRWLTPFLPFLRRW